MPYEKDRLRFQRELDDTYSVHVPGEWVAKQFPSPEAAMRAAQTVLQDASTPETGELLQQRAEYILEADSFRSQLATLEKAISSIDADLRELESDADDVIDAGYDAIELFKIENRYTRRFGPPINVAVTPYDKDRDGVVAIGEFAVMMGWSRYRMVEPSVKKVYDWDAMEKAVDLLNEEKAKRAGEGGEE